MLFSLTAGLAVLGAVSAHTGCGGHEIGARNLGGRVITKRQVADNVEGECWFALRLQVSWSRERGCWMSDAERGRVFGRQADVTGATMPSILCLHHISQYGDGFPDCQPARVRCFGPSRHGRTAGAGPWPRVRQRQMLAEVR